LLKAGSVESFISEPANSYTAKYLVEYLNRKKSQASPIISHLKQDLADKSLSIRGAREHNLKNIDINIPLDKIVALIGVSGSGKSSIAKDIIYSEGQRRYLDCLSPYARQFIKELKKPDIDGIQNLKPTICVYQHTFQPGHLSTVGTMSEAYNFLRLLYSKTADQYCPDHPKEKISALSAEAIRDAVLELSDSQTRILAPIVKLKKGSHRQIFERAVRSEINEVRVDGLFVRPSDFHYDLEKNKVHSIDYVIARFNKDRIDKDMLLDATRQALALGGGTLIVHTKNSEEVLSAERTCPRCNRGFFKPDPEDLSFHSKRGACSRCHGSGLDKKGAPCPSCKGARLNTLGRHLRLADKNIYEASLLGPQDLRDFLQTLSFDSRTSKIAQSIMKELLSKLDILSKMGLDYLNLNRDCQTLSGGELQRLRLAAAMGSPLSGVLYIFDEPSAGLHPIDNLKVLEEIRELKNSGNSVIIIEHDAQSILSSEYVIEVGPGGGTEGGHIVFEGSVEAFKKDLNSISSRAMRESAALPPSRIQSEAPLLSIQNASKNNLKNINLELPLASLVVVAGVSGAGKSSLVHGVISKAIVPGKNKSLDTWEMNGTKLKSSINIDRVLLIDQKPIGLNSRSTPASYLGIWDHMRNVFASTLEAKTRGLSASYFSYNTGKGRCPDCKGLGLQKLEMSFLPDASIICDSCNGQRFTDDALLVKFKDLSVSDVLNLTLEEARALFSHHRKIHHALHNACELGLGYLTLGQSSATLSGGESQRMKLVAELSGSQRGHTLYLLDEPTTGLHKSDVARLIKTLRSLVDHNNSVIIIEHEEDIIRSADHVLELGPGAGDEGGRVIFSGSPKLLQKAKTPWGSLLKSRS
ncbi:MAG: ATP-binding cassette domain-containing protein, partial [SAR324 cluster bacterium]|nr:ATP-binding cassette domain-containing protein [SAR324 cluster bacterium]